MTNNILFPQIQMHPSEDKIRDIHKDIMKIMIKLGGNVVNSSYILLEGIAQEAHGYYKFPGLGIVTVSLSHMKDYRCNVSVKVWGFESERNKYNKIKAYLEEALKRSGLNKKE